ncbi:MAG: hypothetical protein NC131_15745 [Roseburia sp.]|nr:hypothetical protein [Roseburia sp.]
MAAIERATESGDVVLADTLRTLFGVKQEAATEAKDNRPVTERIKTFEDAVRELGEDNELVFHWRWMNGCECDDEKLDADGKTIPGEFSDIKAYLKLRIITEALNEGWKPQFTEDEWRYFPYFVLYTQEELDNLDEEERRRVVYRSYSSASANGGVAFASTYYDTAFVNAFIGSRLAFKTRELAIYAGQQFKEIYAIFCLNSEFRLLSRPEATDGDL